MGRTQQDVEDLYKKLKQREGELGLKISKAKTKHLLASRREQPPDHTVVLDEDEFESCKELVIPDSLKVMHVLYWFYK